jgi:hypothetical protein
LSQCSFAATTVGSTAAAATVAALVWAEPRRRPGVPRRVAPLHLGLRLWLGPAWLHERAVGDQTSGLGRADDAAVAWDRLSHSQRTPSVPLLAAFRSDPSREKGRSRRLSDSSPVLLVRSIARSHRCQYAAGPAAAYSRFGTPDWYIYIQVIRSCNEYGLGPYGLVTLGILRGNPESPGGGWPRLHARLEGVVLYDMRSMQRRYPHG